MTQPHQCPSCLQYWQPYEELAGVHTCSGYQPVIPDPRDAEIAKLRKELAAARKVIRQILPLAEARAEQYGCDEKLDAARAFLAAKETRG